MAGGGIGSIIQTLGALKGQPVPGPQAPPPQIPQSSGGGILDGNQAAAMADAGVQIGPPGPEQIVQEQVGPPVERAGPSEKSGFFDEFFGSIDESFQSPAKTIGVGLLNQQKRGLGTGLLIGKGLLDAFRR